MIVSWTKFIKFLDQKKTSVISDSGIAVKTLSDLLSVMIICVEVPLNLDKFS